MKKARNVQLPPWLMLPFVLGAFVRSATADAPGAAIKLSQANETSRAEELSNAPLERRQASDESLSGPTYTSIITTIEVFTAPTVTITSFFDGLPVSGRAITASTAATSPTPTDATGSCALDSNGLCVRDYYDAMKICYSAGTLSSARNVAQHFIDCQNELGANGSYESFWSCSLEHAQRQISSSSAAAEGIQKRSTLRMDGAVVVTDDELTDALDSAGIMLMDESELWDLEYGTDDEWRRPRRPESVYEV
ncbi:hypothetical protein ABW21_db0206513 [Orbilia brochopaga]|nr:hypothetical protein ABW21_db0206513 [Drechslerella brochopaga]